MDLYAKSQCSKYSRKVLAAHEKEEKNEYLEAWCMKQPLQSFCGLNMDGLLICQRWDVLHCHCLCHLPLFVWLPNPNGSH
jgi:hypothetical protein